MKHDQRSGDRLKAPGKTVPKDVSSRARLNNLEIFNERVCPRESSLCEKLEQTKWMRIRIIEIEQVREGEKSDKDSIETGMSRR